MAVYFLDSSAAVKLYGLERGTRWMATLASPAGQNELFIVRLTPVEIAATLFRRVKGNRLSHDQALSAVAALHRDLQWVYQVLEFGPEVSDLALGMAEQHGLRGYDCVQLAAALTVRRRREAKRLSPPEFVCADAELNTAAIAEGLQVVDPNDYP